MFSFSSRCFGVGLNDRCEGALEALSYVRAFVEDLEKRGGDLGRVRREVEDLIDLLLRGVVVDFKHRIRRY
jgi:hypothetical protein